MPAWQPGSCHKDFHNKHIYIDGSNRSSDISTKNKQKKIEERKKEEKNKKNETSDSYEKSNLRQKKNGSKEIEIDSSK